MAKKKAAGKAKADKPKAAGKPKAADKPKAAGKPKAVADKVKADIKKTAKGSKVLFIKSPTGRFKLAYSCRDTAEIKDKDLLEKLLSEKFATYDLEYFAKKQ